MAAGSVVNATVAFPVPEESLAGLVGATGQDPQPKGVRWSLTSKTPLFIICVCKKMQILLEGIASVVCHIFITVVCGVYFRRSYEKP